MSETLILRNGFEGLDQALKQAALAREESAEFQPGALGHQAASTNQAVLYLRAELEQAAATLAAIAERDREARLLALSALEEYDRIVADLREAAHALHVAARLRKQAEGLVAHAIDDGNRQAAAEVADVPRRVEAEASRVVEDLRGQLVGLKQRLDLDRLLSERQRMQAAEAARTTRLERAQRLAEALASARVALARDQVEEAWAAVEAVAPENPGNGEIASLLEAISRRQLEVNVALAEEALWLAGRDYRYAPHAAVERLAAVDTAALPEPLARQVFGAWARACLQLCHRRGFHDPIRFGAGPGRGVAFARETPGAPYIVVSAIGMRERWEAGALAPDPFVERALPLRIDAAASAA